VKKCPYCGKEYPDDATIPINQRSTAAIPSPGEEGQGSSEHRERHFLCCSFLGELKLRGHQSALISVHSVQDCTSLTEIRVHLPAAPKLGEGGCPSVVKNPIFTKRTQIENHKLLSLSTMRKNSLASFSKTNPYPLGPGLSKGFKAIQRVWREKIIFEKLGGRGLSG